MAHLGTTSQESPRILVVDDEILIVELLQEFLTYEGFQVTRAPDGEHALQLLQETTFDVLLTDLKMPGLGGLDLLAHLRSQEADTITIVMTGFGTVETALEAMKRGAFDYILKPFKLDEVVALLHKALEKQRLERENVALRQTIGFYELSEALSSALPLEEQLQRLTLLVRDNFQVQFVALVSTSGLQGPLRHIHAGMLPARLQESLLFAKALAQQTVLAHHEAVGAYLLDGQQSDPPVTALLAVPLTVHGMPLGYLALATTRSGFRFSEGQRKGLSIFASRAADVIETHRIYGNLRDSFTQTIEGFARALEAKDAYTHGHSDRVATYTALIGKMLGLPSLEVDRLRHGGLMHDIGKIGMHTDNLNKPERLTAEEYTLFKMHPVVGRRILEPISFLVHLVPCVYYHHESFNGRGYPEGLGGMDIPLEARILAVADAYDAMTSHRPYRRALPHALACRELQRGAGKQFDPAIVQVFFDAIADYRQECIKRGEKVPP